MVALTADNYQETLANLSTSDELTADFTGLKKAEIRAALKLCKEKLSKTGKITVSNIKKNTLILAGFQDVQENEDKSFTGFMPKEIVAVKLQLETSPEAAKEGQSSSQQQDPNALLTEADKAKPDTKYDCGVDLGKKRMACKGCTCGLAEELEDEAKDKIKKNLDSGASKPSCGSCFLGDAFRCASCPYAGQPAFDKNAPPKLVGKDDFSKSDI